MKPIKLVMSAFGSYAEKTTISFEDVNSGIFLVAGDTGAGKTTIFDAITYALYDQTSGGMREGNMMRSQYADDDVETYVELTFRYLDDIYIIRRNPEYLRPSKRGGGYTTEASKVELIMPDGKAFMGKKIETNNKIVEILGIDKDQFTQIAMIAQGDFLKLLHASSDERKKIFSRIFDTKIYQKIQDSLKSKEKEINIELAKNKTLCERELNNVDCIDSSSYEELLSTILDNFEFKMDDILKLIDDINKEIYEKEHSIMVVKTEATKKLNQVNSIISNAQTLNNLFDKLNYAIKVKEELELNKELYKSKQKKLDNAKRAELVKVEENKYLDKIKSLNEVKSRIIDINNWLVSNEPELKILNAHLENCEKEKNEKSGALTENIANIKNTLLKYKELENKRIEISQLEKNKKILEEAIVNLKRDLEDKKLTQIKLTNEQESLKNCYQIQADTKIKFSELEKRKIDLEDLGSVIKELITLKTEYNTYFDEANVAFKSYSFKNDEYEKCYREFLSEQAGVLAKERLIDNMPCPVCGSTEHPNVAKLSDHAATQADVEAAKLVRDTAEKVNNSAKEKLQSAKHKYDIKLDLAKTKAVSILGADFVMDKDGVNKVKLELNECKFNLAILNKELEKASTDINKFESNKLALDNISNEIVVKTTKLEESNNAYSEVKLKYEGIKITIEEINKQLLYATKVEAENQINVLQNSLNGLNEAVINATNNYNRLSKTIEMRKGQQISEIDNEKRINIEVEKAKAMYTDSIEINNFNNEEDYENAKMKVQEILPLENDIDGYNKKVSEIAQAINIYTEQTKDKKRIEIDTIKEEQIICEQNIIELDKKLKTIYALGVKNNEAKNNIKELFEERKKSRASYEIYSTLSATANGRLTDRSKIDFETYVQRQYFNKIISAANQRLVKMTSGQFILQCREFNDLGNRGSVGLDLDVYSLVTDSIRDIKTLSGGESFMAALSMALGLADVVQLSAGAVHLDTMFIDEGFGSLDDNSRTQAISVLNELAGNNRLVGIISHVNELKEQIDNKLIVKKTDKGSKVSWSI